MIEIEVEIECLLKEHLGYNFRDVSVKPLHGNYGELVLGSVGSTQQALEIELNKIQTPPPDYSFLDLSSNLIPNSIYTMFTNQYIKINNKKIRARLYNSFPVMCFSVFTNNEYKIKDPHMHEDILWFLKDPTLHIINVPKTLEYQKNGFLE